MILCTGSAGFIGQNLVRKLKTLGGPKHAESFVTYDPHDGEGHDPLPLIYDLRVSAVFHLGAISDTTCTDEDALWETNVALPMKLARFCQERRIPFIYASSASVYGNGDGPLNAYANVKLYFDEWALAHLDHDWYGCRFFNVYGPGEAHKGKQASLVHQILKGKHDFFRTETTRDFIHVYDVVDVMLWLWRTRPQSGIYDVGTGESVTIAKLHDEIERAMGISNGYVDIPMPESLKGKYQFHTCADLRKLRGAGYDRPFMPVGEGVARMLR